MAKTPAKVVSSARVWIVEGNRQDNGNALYYRVWASTPAEAQAYLNRTELAGIQVKFSTFRELSDGRYEQTINCKINHPERYED